MSNESNQKRNKGFLSACFSVLMFCYAVSKRTHQCRVITLSLTFFHLLFAKHFLVPLCCGIRQICFTYIIISMPTITWNSVQTSLSLLAERKSFLSYLTMWMPINVHFRKLRTGQHKNALTAGPKVIRLSFFNSSHPCAANRNILCFIILQTSSWSDLCFLFWWLCVSKSKLSLSKLHASDSSLENVFISMSYCKELRFLSTASKLYRYTDKIRTC